MEDNKRSDYREQVKGMGKKEFTLMKMQEYGFWPENLPTPFERQEKETESEYEQRRQIMREYNDILKRISNAYKDLGETENLIRNLKKKYDDTWDYEKIRQYISKQILKESLERRAEKKAKKEAEKKQKSESWQKKKAENIVFIGKGYSAHLSNTNCINYRLNEFKLPIINDDKELASFLKIDYSKLRSLCYHRDVEKIDQYYRFEVPKRSGGMRKIAAPKSGLKAAQSKILTEILEKLDVSKEAHGFIKNKSVVTGAMAHDKAPALLINMDLENFFPTITFYRVRGLFEGFGYSGYIASLLAMLCTDCDRVEMEIKSEKYYVKNSERVLPQGSPASPAITNIICKRLDDRLSGLAKKYGFTYTRYADDMSFSLPKTDKVYDIDISQINVDEIDSKKVSLQNNDETININNRLKTADDSSNDINIGAFLLYVKKIAEAEGFKVNDKKTRILRQNARQSVTGIVINNEEIGVSKKWVKNFRAMLYNTRKQIELGNIDTVDKKTVQKISGRVAWLESVNPKKYSKIISEAKQLITTL